VYIIRHDFETFNWELTFYQAADGPFKKNDIDGQENDYDGLDNDYDGRQ
jgi:hypothetical protein